MTSTRSTLRMGIALVAVLLLGAACANDGGSDAGAGTGSSGTAGVITGSTGGGGTGTTSSGGANGGGGGGRYDYGNDDKGGGGGKDDSGMDDSGGGDHGSEDVALTADNFAFSPTTLEVASGSEIYVENANSGTSHTFTVDGTSIDLELSPGDVEDVDIDLDPGSYGFHCRFHASMTGTLTVT